MQSKLSNDSASHPRGGRLHGLAAEPYRLFFVSGILWSIAGVSLWPLFYLGQLGFAPHLVHARLMIEAFGGAFVTGFLGTAVPRLSGAPALSPGALVWLLGLHQASALAHLAQRPVWGDALFVLLLSSLLASLAVRASFCSRESPPPQLLLAWAGLLCGAVGAGWLMTRSVYGDARSLRLAGLLLNQGFLLLPALGIGSLLFPRMLGGEIREMGRARERCVQSCLCAAAALLVTGSFVLEAWGAVLPGYGLRLATAAGYLAMQVPRNHASSGTLGKGIYWAWGCGSLAWVLAGFFYPQHVSVEHLLYVGGIGLLILVVGSRVLFGHSGDLPGAEVRGGAARWLIGLVVLAAVTRAAPAWSPRTTISHHIYAAITWVLVATLWLIWHRRRFFRGYETNVS
jgi:uncharacterized protein involved in response to NO